MNAADCKLLEAAAKAEGHAYPWVLPARGGERPWNPLTDDGDALRLFLALPWMCIETSDVGVTVRERGEKCERVYFKCTEWLDEHEGDLSAATRRAIVRAATIGKEMK